MTRGKSTSQNNTLSITPMDVTTFIEFYKTSKNIKNIATQNDENSSFNKFTINDVLLGTLDIKNINPKLLFIYGDNNQKEIANLDLSNEDFTGFVFSNVTFKNCNLTKANFSRCLMHQVKFSECPGQETAQFEGIRQILKEDNKYILEDPKDQNNEWNNYQKNVFEGIFYKNSIQIDDLNTNSEIIKGTQGKRRKEEKTLKQKLQGTAIQFYNMMMPKCFLIMGMLLGFIIGIKVGILAGLTFMFMSAVTITSIHLIVLFKFNFTEFMLSYYNPFSWCLNYIPFGHMINNFIYNSQSKVTIPLNLNDDGYELSDHDSNFRNDLEKGVPIQKHL